MFVVPLTKLPFHPCRKIVNFLKSDLIFCSKKSFPFLYPPAKPFWSNRLSLIQFSNSKSELFFLLSLIATASLPTKYLVLGFSDLIALKMTSATCDGTDALAISNAALTPSDTFLENSAYGESEFVAFLGSIVF